MLQSVYQRLRRKTIWMQCRRGRDIAENQDKYEEGEDPKAFQHANRSQGTRVGLAMCPRSEPEEGPPVVGVGQPMGALLASQGTFEQVGHDSGSRSERNLLELSVGDLAGRVAQVSWLNFI